MALAVQRGVIGWSVVALASIAASVGVSMRLAALPPPELDVNMLFVPPPAVTRGAAAGYENLIADGLWLGLIQYYGDRVSADNKTMVNLGPMFDLITDLDPNFWFAYWLGAWALGDNHEAQSALRLLAKGERLHPDDYNYPYLQGFIDFLFLADYGKAAQDFTRASTKPNAERFARTMAARMLQKSGQDQQALGIWESMYAHAQDNLTKRIAKRNIDRIHDEMTGKRKRAFPVGHREGEAL